MAKGKGSSASESNPYTVFVDTNLNTHLVCSFSEEDTAHDVKQKIMAEHIHCFPKFGEITVEAVKVRRQEHFYHLSDSIHVKGVFNGVNETWFIYVDATSSQVEPNGFCIMDVPAAETEKNNIQLDQQPKGVPTLGGSSDIMNQGKSSVSLEQNKTYLGTNKRTVSGKLKRHDLGCNENEVLETHNEQKKDESGMIREMQFDDILEEAAQLEPANKKRRKINKSEVEFSIRVKDPSKGSDTGMCASNKETSKPDNLFLDNSSGKALQAKPVVEKKHTNEKKKGDSFCDPNEDTMKENDSGTSHHSKETSKPEKMSHENSLEDQQQASIRPVGSSVNEKSTKKKKSSRIREGVDSVAPLSKKNVRQEKESAEKNDKDFGKESEAETSPEETLKSLDLTNISAISEKERNCGPVQEMGEEITAASTLLGAPHAVVVEPSASGNVDAENGGSKVGSETVAQEQAVSSRVKKAKKVKKHKVEESGKLNRDITPLISDVGVPDNDTVGTVLTNKTEVKEKTLPPNGDPELLSSSVQDEAEMNINDGIVSLSPTDASDIIKKGDVSYQRKKMSSKTTKASVARRTGKKHVTGSDVSVPLRFESDEAFDGDHPGHETKTGGDIFARTGRESKLIKDGGPGDVNIDTDQIDNVEKEEKKGDPTPIFSKEIDLKRKSSVRSEEEMSDKNMMVSSKLSNAFGVTKALVRGDKKKKSKKTKTSDATVSVSASVENVDSARDAFLEKEADKGSENVDNPLQLTQITNVQEIIDSKEHKVKRKSIKTKHSTSKNYQDPPKEQKVLSEDLMPSNDENKNEENAPPKKVKKSRSRKPTLEDKLSEALPEGGKDTALNADSSQYRISRNDGSFQLPSDTLEHNVVERPLEENFGGDYLVNGCLDEDNSRMKAPKEQNVLSEDLIPSNDENKNEENAPPKTVKKSRSRRPTLEDKLSEPLPEGGKDTAFNADSSQYQISRNDGSFQLSSDILEHNVVDRPLEENFVAHNLVNGCLDEDNSHMKAPNVDDDELDFSQYFVPGHEVATPAKANKKIKKVNKHSAGPVLGEQEILDSNENQGHKKKREGSVSDIVPGPLSKDERKSTPPPKVEGFPDKASKQNQRHKKKHDGGVSDTVSGPLPKDERKHTPPPKVETFPDKALRTTTIVNASGTVTPVLAHQPRSSSYIESSVDRVYKNEKKAPGDLQSQTDQYCLTVNQFSSGQMGEVLNSSNHQKSLLATSNTISEDNSTESSQDAGEVNNSASSTRTPSASSSEDDDSDLDYSQGSYGKKGNDDDVILSQSKNMTLDMILRSSRSYKKAKLKATESQFEDTESQHEIVWDSQV